MEERKEENEEDTSEDSSSCSSSDDETETDESSYYSSSSSDDDEADPKSKRRRKWRRRMRIVKKKICGWNTKETRLKVHQFLDDPHSSRGALVCCIVMVSLIVLSVIVLILQETPNVRHGTTRQVLNRLEISFNVIFTAEILLRLWIVNSAWYAMDIYLAFDVLSVLPFWLSLALKYQIAFAPSANGFLTMAMKKRSAGSFDGFKQTKEMFKALRMLRLLKLTRRYDGSIVIVQALSDSASALVAPFFFLLVAVIICGTALYFVEEGQPTETKAEEKPQHFVSVIHTIWFMVVAFLTVGFGDVYPMTPLGKILTGVAMFFGIFDMAMIYAIVGNNFCRVWDEKDKVIFIQKLKEQFNHMNITRRDVEAAFRELDLDGSGTLDFDEFSRALNAMDIKFNDLRKRALYDGIDEHQHGGIQMEDFVDLVFVGSSGGGASTHFGDTSATLSSVESKEHSKRRSSFIRRFSKSLQANNPKKVDAEDLLQKNTDEKLKKRKRRRKKKKKALKREKLKSEKHGLSHSIKHLGSVIFKWGSLKAASIVPYDKDDDDDDNLGQPKDVAPLPNFNKARARTQSSSSARSSRRKSSGYTIDSRRRSSGVQSERRISAGYGNTAAASSAQVAILTTRMQDELSEIIKEQQNLYLAHTQLSAKVSEQAFNLTQCVLSEEARANPINEALAQCAARLCIHANALEKPEIAEDLQKIINILSGPASPSNSNTNSPSKRGASVHFAQRTLENNQKSQDYNADIPPENHAIR